MDAWKFSGRIKLFYGRRNGPVEANIDIDDDDDDDDNYDDDDDDNFHAYTFPFMS
jgi:hypothetical protein